MFCFCYLCCGVHVPKHHWLNQCLVGFLLVFSSCFILQFLVCCGLDVPYTTKVHVLETYSLMQVLGGVTFKRWSGHEDAAFMNELMLLLWEWVSHKSGDFGLIFLSLSLFLYFTHSLLSHGTFCHVIIEQEGSHQMQPLGFTLPSLQNLESNKLLSFMIYPVFSILLHQQKIDNF